MWIHKTLFSISFLCVCVCVWPGVKMSLEFHFHKSQTLTYHGAVNELQPPVGELPGNEGPRSPAVHLQQQPKRRLLAALLRPLKWDIVAYQIWMSHACCSRIAFFIRKLKLIDGSLVRSTGTWRWDSLQEKPINEQTSQTGERRKKKTKTQQKHTRGCRAEHKHTANKMFMLS